MTTCHCFQAPVDDCPIHGVKASEPEESGGMCIDVAEIMRRLKIGREPIEAEKVTNIEVGVGGFNGNAHEIIDRLIPAIRRNKKKR
jgi:hypothetical protein